MPLGKSRGRKLWGCFFALTALLTLIAGIVVSFVKFWHPMSILGRLLSWFLTILCAIYLLRVPLLTGLGVIFLYWAAFFTPSRPLLENGFDVGSFLGLVYVSLTSFLLAWVLMVTGRLVQLHGGERFFGAASSRTALYVRWLRRVYYALVP